MSEVERNEKETKDKERREAWEKQQKEIITRNLERWDSEILEADSNLE